MPMFACSERGADLEGEPGTRAIRGPGQLFPGAHVQQLWGFWQCRQADGG